MPDLELPAEPVALLLSILNAIGIFVFAISGSLAAIRRQIDFFGVMVLALVTSSAGGVFRDILIGQLPPALIRETFALSLSAAAGVITYIAYPLAKKLRYPIDFFDALGLGAFSVIGASKALSFGISPAWAICLGAITGVGGGVVRDMLLAEVPIIFRQEVYATPAILGAAILVGGTLWHPELSNLWTVTGAVSCSGLRLVALHNSWNLPRRKI